MPTRVLWIENCYPISTRSRRIIDTLRLGAHTEVVVCAWDRRRDAPSSGERPDAWEYRYVSPIGYSSRVAKLCRLPGFVRFVGRVMEAALPVAIAASFWDMALVGATLSRGRLPLLYDVIDMPEGRGFRRLVARCAERLALRRTRAVLLASRFFEPFYSGGGRQLLILENLPDLVLPQAPPQRSHDDVRVAYVGNLRYAKTLLPLLRACRASGRELDLWGDGALLPRLQREFGRVPGIRFHGRYHYDRLPDILGNVDVLWAAYPSDDVNVRHAISNKFFESVGFAIPAVFSADTALGNYIALHGIGFCVDASNDVAVTQFIGRLNPATVSDVRHRLTDYRREHAGALTWNDVSPALVQFARNSGFADG